MDESNLARVARFAPPWVRYLLTASEIARSGQGWVVSAGDDIAVIEVDGVSAMPLWPYQLPADRAAGNQADASSVDLRDLMEGVLPALAANEVGVATFPNGNDFSAKPEAFARDLATFVEDKRDMAAELEAAPRAATLESPLALEMPGAVKTDGTEPDAEPRFWLLLGEGGTSVIGGMVDEQPTLALFGSEASAEQFATSLPRPATVTPATSAELINRWLLLAFSGEWQVAIVAAKGAEEVGLVSPARLALDLAEEIVQS